MKAKVNHTMCVGCELCASLNPEIFEMNQDGLAEAVNETEDEAKLQEAIDSCPVSAISVEE